ncbi:hypothetical protein EI94DRAFT_17068 [Lactarius quietus]|nr:hypothetical protein EI94DRAFT_17068 [Lactarius quietus]
MEHITRRRAAKVRPYRTCSTARRLHWLLYVYVILKAAPLRTFQVSTRLSSTGSQFLPGPNSTGRRSVTFIPSFSSEIQFPPCLERRNQFPCSVSRPSRLEGVFLLPLLLQPSACRVLTSAGRNIVPCSGHVKPYIPSLWLLARQRHYFHLSLSERVSCHPCVALKRRVRPWQEFRAIHVPKHQ